MRNARLFASFEHFISRRKSPIFALDRKKSRNERILSEFFVIFESSNYCYRFLNLLKWEEYKNITRDAREKVDWYKREIV